MKAAAAVLSAFFLFPMSSAHSAWNWNGTLKARVQTDNRYTRYVNRPEVFGEIWGSFQAFNNDQARHATSRNSGTPVALIRSPTQRMGDALNALRP